MYRNRKLSIVKWGNDGTKIANLSVTFHQSLTWCGITLTHKCKILSTISICQVPCMIIVHEKLPKNQVPYYSVDWGKCWDIPRVKLGQCPIFTQWYMFFYGVKMVHKKIIDYSQVKSTKLPSKNIFIFRESIYLVSEAVVHASLCSV